MPKKTMEIWGRKFRLDVIFDVYEGEEILPSQKESLDKITSNPEAIDSTLQYVKKYCLKSELLGDTKEIENIFKYVKPKALFVKRNKKSRVVALICDYKLDIEHGMAIVFKNESFFKIGAQDIIA